MNLVSNVIVVAYKEDVTELIKALKIEGYRPFVQRAEYNQDEISYSKNSRTFINHKNAWLKAAKNRGYTLICESDFVPCKGLSNFPIFWPSEDDKAWGYLYQGSPRLLSLVGSNVFLRGHCAPLVAYVINSSVAKVLLDFYEEEFKTYTPYDYFSFDSHLQWYAMGKDCKAYMPLKHYGEHGGLPNNEHSENGKLMRGGAHHADNLMSDLHFLPQYSNNSLFKYYLIRLNNRTLGWLRLLSGRWIVRTNVYSISIIDYIKMFKVGVSRLL